MYLSNLYRKNYESEKNDNSHQIFKSHYFLNSFVGMLLNLILSSSLFSDNNTFHIFIATSHIYCNIVSV